MMGESPTIAVLQMLANPALGQPAEYPIDPQQGLVLGREPSCQVVLDSQRHAMVSRRHAEIRLAAVQSLAQPVWWICDLNSANGTFLNGRRLQGCSLVQAGDRIMLGQQGPEFQFTLRPVTLPPRAVGTTGTTTLATRPAAVPVAVGAAIGAPNPATPDELTLTQLFPIFSSGLDLRRKAFLLPGAISVGFVVALFAAVGRPVVFNLILAAYLAIACYYFVYRLCGKPKPWWVLVLTAGVTALLLRSPVLPLFSFVFRELLPGAVRTDDRTLAFPVQLVQMFFGAGLMEELLKALPLLVLLGLSGLSKSRSKSRWGIVEPLDGILLGAAAAIGFTMIETLGQYVPSIIQNTQLQAGEELSQLQGLQLLIPRLLGSISGHMAYSGYFGYFIGLTVLRPQQRWTILAIGYVTAAGLHALWNAMGGVSPLLLAITGMLSYAFLATAIVKARSLSPNRAQNFATRLN
jgi:RsiW-degrading membrane proteinase PrsW (M82 family)